jgi:purine-nucleoside phosphorylase
MTPSALDEAVFAAHAELMSREAIAPSALFFLGTGLGLLPGRLARGRRFPLAEIRGVPASWRDALVHWGEFNGLPVWMIEDAPGEGLDLEPPWAGGFPVWLAAAAGASVLVHTSAGHGLPSDGQRPLEAGSFALFSDHVNLSGGSPLVGIGESRLGPMFPDLSLLHDPHLRECALRACERLGVAAEAVVGACTLGPAIETPAELRWFARAGARVAVQRLATPLLAAAHAGMGVLAIAVVTRAESGPLDIARLAATSSAIAPALDDFLWELAGDVQREGRAALEREE